MKEFQIKGSTFCIDTGMTYLPFYKVTDTDIIMIDSGWADGEQKGISKLLQEGGYQVKGIINTHAHIDHSGNNVYLKEKYGALIAMSKVEARICSSLINLKMYYYRHTLTDVEKYYGHMVCETDIEIREDQNSLYMCGIKFKVCHTPGHSPGHICIITPDGVAYVGDALITDVVMKSAKLPYAHVLRRDLASKEKLKSLKCDKYVVAHKGIFDNIHKLIDVNIGFYKLRADKVLREISYMMTMEDLLKIVVQKWGIIVNSPKKYIVIERMLRYYVDYLHEIGEIEQIVNDGFVKYRRCDEAYAN